jgi:hypothetical protein
MPTAAGIFFGKAKGKTIMDAEFLNAIDKTADTSFDASAPTDTDASAAPTNCNGDTITCPVVLNLLANPRFVVRRSGITTTGFLDGERKPGAVTPTKCPPYLGPPSGRSGTADEKRCAWQLEEEYLAGRLGKNAEENSRLWNTVLWIDKHHRVTTTPAEAFPPLNIYVSDKLKQSTEGTGGAPTGPDDEAPDEGKNEGFGFKSFNICAADESGSTKVMDKDGTTHRVDIKADDYIIGRLVDELEEIDKIAKIDVDKLQDKPAPLPQVDFPDLDQRVESGKIIRMLMLGMHTLWHPVIRAIASQATMKSLGRSQGVGDDKAATVGRWRVIEGLRLAESIRRRLERQKLAPARSTTAARPKIPSVSEMMGPLAVPKAVRAPASGYLNQAAGPVIKRDVKPLHANDNCRAADIVSKAA